MDNNQDGVIDLEELNRFMEDNGIIVQNKELCLLLLRFDKNDDKVISFAEFITEIHPKSK